MRPNPNAPKCQEAPFDVRAQAEQLGLRVEVWLYRGLGGTAERDCVVWMIQDASGRDLGSWVPHTTSLRVLGKIITGVLTPMEALAHFHDLTEQPKVAA